MFDLRVIYLSAASVFLLNEIVFTMPLTDTSSSLAPYLNKKYKLASSDEKFDEVMKALGVGVIKRQMAKLASPVMELTEKNGEYTLSSESTFKNTYTKFRMNEEFDETTPDDRVVKTTFTQDKNKLIQIQKGDGKTTRITREFTSEKVTVVVEVDGIASVRTYEAL